LEIKVSLCDKSSYECYVTMVSYRFVNGHVCQPWTSSSKLFYLFMLYTQCLQQYSQQVGNINEFLLRNNNYILYRFNKQIKEIILLYLGQNKSTSFFRNQ
jgi:hypothetical protein